MDAREQRTFAANRRALMTEAGDGLILVPGGGKVRRSGDVDFVFRQTSDFLYATGVEHPGFALLLHPRSGQEVLFIPKIDTNHRVWLGHVPGPAESKREYGVGRVEYIDALPAWVKKLGGRGERILTDSQGLRMLKAHGVAARADRMRYQDLFATVRAVKGKGEIALMREASEVSGAAHVAAMQAVRPGMREYQVQAVVEQVFMDRGLKHCAYPSIVAAGVNGAVLHYHDNDDELRAGDLMLIDAGAEKYGYAADITRTFPISGRFDSRQRDVYQVVLDAQEACIAAIRPGVMSAEVHRLSQLKLAAGLVGLGLMKGEPEALVESEAVRVFYPHGIGHMLGLDVHDVDGGKKRRPRGPKPKNLRFNRKLEVGFVMTVEPGLYFIEALLDDPEKKKKHKGQIDFARARTYLDFGGVRIEDDVVVQDGPVLNLTAVPKTVSDIERVMARA